MGSGAKSIHAADTVPVFSASCSASAPQGYVSNLGVISPSVLSSATLAIPTDVQHTAKAHFLLLSSLLQAVWHGAGIYLPLSRSCLQPGAPGAEIAWRVISPCEQEHSEMQNVTGQSEARQAQFLHSDVRQK